MHVVAFAVSLATQTSFDARVASAGLLQYPAVQRELKMSLQQVADTTRAENAYWIRVKRTGDNNTEVERREVLRYLDAAQLRRLREISLQDSGPVALLADIVAERIGADQAKQREIKKVFEAMVDEVVRPMQDEISKMSEEVMRPAAGDARASKARAREVDAKASLIAAKYSGRNEREIQRRAPALILAVLSPAQKRAWTDLLGRPFDLGAIRGVKPRD